MRKQKIPFKLMLSPETHDWLCREAEARDMSRMGVIMQAIQFYRFQSSETLIRAIREAIREELK